jgi:minor extracellular serine protease Vpr
MKQKSRAPRRAFILVALVTLVALSAAAVAAADEGDGATPLSRAQQVDVTSTGIGDGLSSFLPASMSNKQVSVMLKMSGAPVIARGNLSAKQKAQVRADLKASQDAIAKDIAKAGGTVVGQTQDVYNGILVHVAQKDVAGLASLPGVTGVQPVGLYTTPTNVNGVPLIRAPQAWGSASNLTGAGVNLAIIDTGIDYTHADFGGPGTAAAWAGAQTTSTQPSIYVGPSAPKVKAGWDFAGDDYNANVAGSLPQQDPNPLDCNGHGSHTSGTAAGFGVLADGSTYGGAYGATTVSDNSWLVGPGVAPKANLYEYRVFGCAGSTDLVILAINKAVQDGANVISMSLGSPFGTNDQTDAEMTAVNNAVANHVTVVSAAGNNGTSAYLVSAPSSANHALSVAAIDGSVANYPGGLLHLSGGDIKAINANGASFANGLTGQVRVLRDASQPGGVSLGCDPAEYAGSTGKIVVVQRGTCARVARAIYGQKGGATAVVMINSSTALPPFEGKITSNPDTGESFTVTIPFFGVKGIAGSGADATKLIADDGKTITIDNTTTPNLTYLNSASFTSGGPRIGDSAAKPEISAPGVSVASVLMGGGTAATIESGTSMATPMTAGAAALVKQAHPSWGGDQVKAALVNTADASQIVGYNGRVNGSGLVQADAAADTNAVATTADGLDSLSFGYAESASGDWTAIRTFTVTNYGSSAISYNLSKTTPSGTTLTATPGSFTVAGSGGTQDVTVTLTIPASKFASLASDSALVIGLGAVQSLRGDVTAVPTTAGAHNLRVPLLAVARGLSSVTPSVAAPFVKQQTNNVYTSSTTVTNTGLHAGTADVYAWGMSDPQDLPAGSANDIRDVGVQSFSDGSMGFAINGYNTSSTPATQEFDVAIDTQHNGRPDYFVVGADLGAVTTGTFSGQFASFVFDAKTGKRIGNPLVADSTMNGSTVVIYALASELGLQAANTSFNYAVNGYSIFGGPVDSTSWAAYNLAKPGVSSGNFVKVAATGGTATIPLWADYDALQSAPALGWLIVNDDDTGGAAQADTVALGALK